jgi:hypothetical protein
MSQPAKSGLAARLQAIRARLAAPFRDAPEATRPVLGVEVMEDRSVPSTVSGTVWFDANNNGIQDTGEGAAAGVGITLSPMSGSPVSTNSNADGSFSFAGVGSGSYSVAVSAPAGYTANGPMGIYVGTSDVSFGVGLTGSGSQSGSGSGSGSSSGSASPSISLQVADQQNPEGAAVAVQVQATNTGGGTLSYSASGLPSGLIIDPMSGAITGTVAAGASTGGIDAAGHYLVTVSVTNGTATADASFSWTVPGASAPSSTGQQTFTLPDGTVGTLTYTIPWDQVDPTQASQALVPTSFNLNLAGQDFAYGSANYTAAPVLLFSNGTFQGVNFTLDTTAAPAFAYTTVVLNGLNATVTQVGGQQFFVAAPPTTTMETLDFSTVQPAGFDYTLTVGVTYADGTVKQVEFTVKKGTTGGGLRDAVYSALKGQNLPAVPVLSGDNRLILEGTNANALKSVTVQAPKQAKTLVKPSVADLFVSGSVATPDVTPTFTLNIYNP